MYSIRYVTEQDRAFWFSLDRHMPEAEFSEKVRRNEGYVLSEDGIPCGILRYNLFWDNTPFCTMLFVDFAKHKKGYGRALMEHWENDMREKGYGMIMTSTQVDENAQHFYRHLGYKDAGCLLIDIPGYEQPMEMFLTKDIRRENT